MKTDLFKKLESDGLALCELEAKESAAHSRWWKLKRESEAFEATIGARLKSLIVRRLHKYDIAKKRYLHCRVVVRPSLNHTTTPAKCKIVAEIKYSGHDQELKCTGTVANEDDLTKLLARFEATLKVNGIL